MNLILHWFFLFFAMMCCLQIAQASPAPVGYNLNEAREPAQGSNPTGHYHTGRCKKPIVRREWCVLSSHPIPRLNFKLTDRKHDRRTLTDAEKKAYITAVQCLQHLPATGPGEYANSTSLFEDFLSLHITLTPVIHLVVSRWHRCTCC